MQKLTNLRWKGADCGREGMLHPDKWIKTLTVLSHHVGENLSDMNAPVFEELERTMPEESWRGQDGKRSFFRDYQKAWTSLGVLMPTARAKPRGTIVITTAGIRALELHRQGQLRDFYRTSILYYSEVWETPSGIVNISPYEIIATALLGMEENIISILELKNRAELLASVRIDSSKILPFEDGQTGFRRFRSHLTILENAEAIEVNKHSVSITDTTFLLSLVREGLESFTYYNAGTNQTSTDYPGFVIEDLRKRESKTIVVREGQMRFATALRKAYCERCCVTGCSESSVLQACHIINYCGKQSNIINNGLLLAADIHILYDCGLLAITPDYFVMLSSRVTDHRYVPLHGRKIQIPEDHQNWPDPLALETKFDRFLELDAAAQEALVQY